MAAFSPSDRPTLELDVRRRRRKEPRSRQQSFAEAGRWLGRFGVGPLHPMVTNWRRRPIAVLRRDRLSGSAAALTAGGGRTSNSRWRPYCSRSDSSVSAPPAAGIEGTADVAGAARAMTRSPQGQESAFGADLRRNKLNVCCRLVRLFATGPSGTFDLPNSPPRNCQLGPAKHRFAHHLPAARRTFRTGSQVPQKVWYSAVCAAGAGWA